MSQKSVKRPEGPKSGPNSKRVAIKTVLTLVICADIALALALAYMFLARIPYFGINVVQVTGNAQLSKEEIVEAAEVEVGSNLLLIDLEEISLKVAKHPRISSASVYRRFPGKLMIEVTERAPVAILSAERLYYVDKKGRIINRVLPGDQVSYPLFTGVTANELEVEGPAITEMLKRGLWLLSLIQGDDASEKPIDIQEIAIDLNHGLSILTSEGKRIVLGKDDYKNKLERLNRLRRFLRSKGEWLKAGIIDLDYEDRALVRAGRFSRALENVKVAGMI